MSNIGVFSFLNDPPVEYFISALEKHELLQQFIRINLADYVKSQDKTNQYA